MGQGVRSWMRDCPICGESYRLTNWMRRGWGRVTLPVGPGDTDRVVLLPLDTHIMSCAKRAGLAVTPEQLGATLARVRRMYEIGAVARWY
jgi:hypothetical protein